MSWSPNTEYSQDEYPISLAQTNYSEFPASQISSLSRTRHQAIDIALNVFNTKFSSQGNQARELDRFHRSVSGESGASSSAGPDTVADQLPPVHGVNQVKAARELYPDIYDAPITEEEWERNWGKIPYAPMFRYAAEAQMEGTRINRYVYSGDAPKSLRLAFGNATERSVARRGILIRYFIRRRWTKLGIWDQRWGIPGPIDPTAPQEPLEEGESRVDRLDYWKWQWDGTPGAPKIHYDRDEDNSIVGISKASNPRHPISRMIDIREDTEAGDLVDHPLLPIPGRASPDSVKIKYIMTRPWMHFELDKLSERIRLDRIIAHHYRLHSNLPVSTREIRQRYKDNREWYAGWDNIGLVGWTWPMEDDEPTWTDLSCLKDWMNFEWDDREAQEFRQNGISLIQSVAERRREANGEANPPRRYGRPGFSENVAYPESDFTDSLSLNLRRQRRLLSRRGPVASRHDSPPPQDGDGGERAEDFEDDNFEGEYNDENSDVDSYEEHLQHMQREQSHQFLQKRLAQLDHDIDISSQTQGFWDVQVTGASYPVATASTNGGKIGWSSPDSEIRRAQQDAWAQEKIRIQLEYPDNQVLSEDDEDEYPETEVLSVTNEDDDSEDIPPNNIDNDKEMMDAPATGELEEEEEEEEEEDEEEEEEEEEENHDNSHYSNSGPSGNGGNGNGNGNGGNTGGNGNNRRSRRSHSTRHSSNGKPRSGSITYHNFAHRPRRGNSTGPVLTAGPVSTGRIRKMTVDRRTGCLRVYGKPGAFTAANLSKLSGSPVQALMNQEIMGWMRQTKGNGDEQKVSSFNPNASGVVQLDSMTFASHPLSGVTWKHPVQQAPTDAEERRLELAMEQSSPMTKQELRKMKMLDAVRRKKNEKAMSQKKKGAVAKTVAVLPMRRSRRLAAMEPEFDMLSY